MKTGITPPQDKVPDILVVDDTPDNLWLLLTLLKRKGYRVRPVPSGRLAIQAVQHKKPDLVLLDLDMPEMNGYEVCAYLKANDSLKGIPVLFISGLNDAADKVKAFAAGGADYVTKPFQFDEVDARIQTHLTLSRLQTSMEAEVASKTDSLREALRNLQVASLDTIHRLSSAAEYRDSDTGNHVQRVSHHAAAVARRMGQPESFVEMLLYTVPMHDVGKIGIPDSILLKPGKLDASEWTIMKTHTLIGANILSGSDRELLQMAATIALTHHEKWDGTGYPNGLRENDIPLAGRITAIADAFDAMCSRRPYKEPFSVEEALAVIRDETGKHFDPQVVDAFMAVQPVAIDFTDKTKESK